jgi:hypothetical protein
MRAHSGGHTTLKIYGLVQIALFVCLTLTFIGCGKKTAKTINPESLPPSFSQVLVVKNETANKVGIFPAPGSIGEPLALEPGESLTINFLVDRKPSLDESGNPTKDGWTVEIDKQQKFLGMKDDNGVLRIKTSKGQLRDYEIVLGKCWFKNKPPTKDHVLTIREKGPNQSAPDVVLCK